MRIAMGTLCGMCTQYIGGVTQVGSEECKKCDFHNHTAPKKRDAKIHCDYTNKPPLLPEVHTSTPMPKVKPPKKELQIEKCLKISVDLWNEYLKLPVEHPGQVDEFARAIHVIQEKLALKIARIYRPDLYPNKMNEEATDEST